MGHRDSSASDSREGTVRFARSGTASNAAFRNARAENVGVASQSSRLVRAVLLFAVQFYRVFLSPFFGGNCKFYPSCSIYAQEAITIHGARRGSWLALRRLLRCRPFTKGGFDPVPDSCELDVHAGLHTEESAR